MYVENRYISKNKVIPDVSMTDWLSESENDKSEYINTACIYKLIHAHLTTSVVISILMCQFMF